MRRFLVAVTVLVSALAMGIAGDIRPGGEASTALAATPVTYPGPTTAIKVVKIDQWRVRVTWNAAAGAEWYSVSGASDRVITSATTAELFSVGGWAFQCIRVTGVNWYWGGGWTTSWCNGQLTTKPPAGQGTGYPSDRNFKTPPVMVPIVGLFTPERGRGWLARA